jgi:hypothetical protein
LCYNRLQPGSQMGGPQPKRDIGWNHLHIEKHIEK